MNIPTEKQLRFDLTMGGAAALDSSAMILTGEEFDSLCVRINQLVEQRHDDAVLRRDVEQAFGELFPSKQKAAA